MVILRFGSINIPASLDILCHDLAWECWPTLRETIANGTHHLQPHEAFFYPKRLYSLPAVGGEPLPGLMQSYTFYLNDFASIASSPLILDGVDIICRQNFSIPLNETRWNSYTLWVSGLVARLPILAITHSNSVLPQYTRDTHSNQTAGTAYLHIILQVNWHRVIFVGIGITVGQILAILTVLYYCNGIYTRDDSPLATAEILKTVITRFDGGKLMTGEELAVSLNRALGVSVSYGTREGQNGGPPEVDLASGLDPNFPPFPHKPRFWRKTSQKIPEV